MTKYVQLALSTTALFLLSACGGGGSSPTASNPSVIPAVTTAPIATATPTVDPSATPSASGTPSGLPTAKPAITTPTPAPTSSSAATNAPIVQPTLAPVPVTTAKPTIAPTSVPTAQPTVVPTVAPTPVPTVKPTVAPTAKPTVAPTPVPTPTSTTTVGTIPIFKPVANPPQNSNQNVPFNSGLIVTYNFVAFDGGSVTVTWPTDGTNTAVCCGLYSGFVNLTGYNGFPKTLPTVPHSTNTVALLEASVFGESLSFVGGNETYVWNAQAGTPAGAWKVAAYSPSTDATTGWHTVSGTSTTTGTQVVISVPIPSGIGFVANTDTYYAIYQ